MFSIKFSAPAGFGIMEGGRAVGEALSSLGFSVLSYPEYPSRIRGGDNVSQISFSADHSSPLPEKKSDLLVIFSPENIPLYLSERKKGGLLLYNTGENKPLQYSEAVGLPLDEIAQKTAGFFLARNSVAAGAVFGLMGLPFSALRESLKNAFSAKGEKVVSGNQKAAEEGYKMAAKISWAGKDVPPLPKVGKSQLFLSGNEAISRGALEAGVGFAAIYPMTPINSILAILAQKKEENKMIVFTPEDEIAGINSAIGASFAGRRAMVATSGGGFSLMVEAFGMAGAAEIPLVVVEGMRTGPSTGMATWTSQEDLLFLISAGQGEFPRIIFSPGDPAEAYRLTFEAFNLAEIYQLPVVVLTDKYLSESVFSSDFFSAEKWGLKVNRGKLANATDLKVYRRYQLTEDGISPRAFPGQTPFLTNSYVHDEEGFSQEDAQTRVKMKEKLLKKLAGFSSPGSTLYGPKDAKITLVSFGSTKAAVLRAQEKLLEQGSAVNFLHFWRPWPFPQEAKEILGKAKKIISIENNSSGQLARLVKMETGLNVGQQILKDDGRPFFEGEIEEKVPAQGGLLPEADPAGGGAGGKIQ
ncbi:2-oxoacid:acceptor oxidoreductase subunit alpha [Candidatus Shapirobacteria bacterium]|nr:2-oxoacid:acceptor oxidoreductase subunit alpha [Candidatus Shapirobacteria bacterium]